jgi:hypothetical protein
MRFEAQSDLVLPDLLPPEEVEVLCGSGGLHHFPVYVVTISTAHRIKILHYVIEKYNSIFKNQKMYETEEKLFKKS